MTQIETNMQHKALFDVEIIKNHVKFPLEFDGICYIFDQNGVMIANKERNISRETAQDFVNAVNNTDLTHFKPVATNLFTLDENEYICYKSVPIISVRGWGHWQYVNDGGEIYKNIANFLTYCCNCENFDVNLLQ
jgi:hypothetical protein